MKFFEIEAEIYKLEEIAAQTQSDTERAIDAMEQLKAEKIIETNIRMQLILFLKLPRKNPGIRNPSSYKTNRNWTEHWDNATTWNPEVKWNWG